jgi:hypothetical protein
MLISRKRAALASVADSSIRTAMLTLLTMLVMVGVIWRFRSMAAES